MVSINFSYIQESPKKRHRKLSLAAGEWTALAKKQYSSTSKADSYTEATTQEQEVKNVILCCDRTPPMTTPPHTKVQFDASGTPEYIYISESEEDDWSVSALGRSCHGRSSPLTSHWITSGWF